MERFKKDFSFIILDEIALEGLDGITIEGKILFFKKTINVTCFSIF